MGDMADELFDNYLADGQGDGDWNDERVDCKYCGAPCYWDKTPEGKWRLRNWDMKTEDWHTCREYRDSK